MKLAPEQEKLLATIRKIWEAMPSLRFLQLIGNCFGPISPADIYFIDDDKFQECLSHTYDRPGWANPIAPNVPE